MPFVLVATLLAAFAAAVVVVVAFVMFGRSVKGQEESRGGYTPPPANLVRNPVVAIPDKRGML
jgi:hypothetical protein